MNGRSIIGLDHDRSCVRKQHGDNIAIGRYFEFADGPDIPGLLFALFRSHHRVLCEGTPSVDILLSSTTIIINKVAQ